MKKVLRIFMLVIACVALSSPVVEAQRHNGANGSNRERPASSSRPSGGGSSRGQHSGRPSVGGQKKERPSARPAVNNGNRRPEVGGQNRPSRPGNTGGGNRPGAVNKPGNDHRPGVGNKPGNDHRPGVGNKPGNNHRPGGNHAMRPGHGGSHRPPVMRPPHRPYRPSMVRPHYRPMPPRAWRPRPGLPVIRGILGLSFGAAINISLDYLYNNGYTVDGYGNDIVYLRNVTALNYVWTDAALYYGTGGLDASSFYYSTPYYDAGRYNNVYRALVNTYGYPVATDNAGGMMSATWFGGNNGYITLSLGAGSTGRFLTTLTFGL